MNLAPEPEPFTAADLLASRKTDGYPNFGELHALEGFGPTDVIEGLRAVTTMLQAVIDTAEAGAVAVIVRRPVVRTGGPQEFAARGALEMILHAHDICCGLEIPFDPPPDLCRRLFHSTAEWHGGVDVDPTGDAWADLLARSGRRPAPGDP